MPRSTIKLLFFGDIVGRPGREAIKTYLSQLEGESRPDVIIGNVENASHGFGLTEKNYLELKESGLQILTSGNHIWDKRDILNYIDNCPDLLRPCNMAEKSAGRGYGVFEFGSFKLF